ncbi:MAG: L-rhamnose mutarotase [Bifidobacteriaceae bacterium]|jgi:L-rhamnose mutarotase|nr:L-rhamnose mutarotase [Bifidobacteriaceae bacterium]
MERVCFKLQVRPERVEDYKRAHAAVWPEMLAALRDAGWGNYSIFIDADGLVIGYFETDSLDRAQARMAATEVNARWQQASQGMFLDLEVPADQGFVVLEEVFNLDAQLEQSGLGADHA